MLHQFYHILLFITISLLSIPTAHCRWFLLPGVSYSNEFGIVGTLVFISENDQRDRFEVRLEYYGEEEGQVGGRVFIPRETVEWTFEGRYQIAEQKLYSPYFKSYHEALGVDIRYWTEALVSLDFPQGDGFFWGVQTGYRAIYIKDDFQDDPDLLNNTEYDVVYTQGYLTKVGLRSGFERRNNRYNSTAGYYLLAQTDGGIYRAWDEIRPMVQSTLDFRVYHAIGSYNTLVAFNAKGGATQDDVPYFCEFHIGGSASLRGVPVDRYSGSRYYVMRAELRQMLLNDIPSPFRIFKSLYPDFADDTYSAGFVLFTDMGDAWRSGEGWWGVRQNIGAGLRLALPPDVVGSIDIATPLDSDHVEFYLTLGQSF
ncbi:MAG: BamA/TamA family outer membrane protein [bacterium]